MMMLLGCVDNLTYSYLMQHPLILKKELSKCQTDDTEVAMGAQCQLVISAAHELMRIIEEQQADPEKFGQKIMQAQKDYIDSANLLDEQQHVIKELQEKNASSSELQTAQDKLKQIQQEVDQKQYDLNVFMGIVGLNSPE